MSRMKSAFEIAMERAESLEEPTPQERLRFATVPRGERVAAAYLRAETDLKEAVEGCDPEARPYLIEGISKVLIPNLRLARTTVDQQTNQRVLQGIRLVKADKNAVDEIASHVQHICRTFTQYRDQAREQAYQETKDRFQQKAQEALRMYSGLPGTLDLNVESLPEFQQEWAKVASQLDSQYEGALEEQKVLLEGIP